MPVTFDMLNWIHDEFWQADTASVVRTELICAVLLGFFFLLLIEEIEQLTWENAQLGTDVEGDQTITVEIAKSKTDQYNEGEFKVLKAMVHKLCPVKMFAKWIADGKGNIAGSKRISTPGLRTRVAVLFRMAGTACGYDASRMGSHSIRSGGASAMFAAGYEVEVIKRWGRWLSSTFQQYLWRDQLIMSTIGRGMIPLTTHPALQKNNGREGGKSTR